jgi:hypothetical protein
MLSLKHCRRKLGAGCALEDDELQGIEESLYSLATVIVSVFLRQLPGGTMRNGDETESGTGEGPDGRNATLIHFKNIKRNHG